MKKREFIYIAVLTLLIAFMDITGIPGAFFVHIQVADIEPVYFTLMVNFLFIGAAAYLFLKTLRPAWDLGFRKKGLVDGLKKYGIIGALVAAVGFLAFYVGLSPFDRQPSIEKVLIEGVVYYIAGFQVQIAPSVRILMISAFTAGVMWQALSSGDNITELGHMLMLPHKRREFVFCLFHRINELAAVLLDQAEHEKQTREFLQDMISDVSHQLKTPLAALKMYDEIMGQDGTDRETIQEFTRKSLREILLSGSSEQSSMVQSLQETKTPAGLAMNHTVYEAVLTKDKKNEVVDVSLDVENTTVDAEINVYKVGEMLNPENHSFGYGKKTLEGV